MGLNAGWPSNRSSMDLLKMLKEEIPNALMDWFVTIKSKKTKQNKIIATKMQWEKTFRCRSEWWMSWPLSS
jgi:hypothetical protein